MSNVPVDKVKEFEEAFLTAMETQAPDTLDYLRNRKNKLTGDQTSVLEKIGAEVAAQFKA